MTLDCCGHTISDYGQKILRIVNIVAVVLLIGIGVILISVSKTEPVNTAGALLIVAGVMTALISFIVYCYRSRQPDSFFV